MGNFGICMGLISNSKWYVPTKIKLELPPELKIDSRGIMNRQEMFKSSIGPIISVSIMNVKHDMALHLNGRFEGCLS